MNNKTPIKSFKFWRWTTNAWTLIFFIAIAYDFFNGNVLVNNDVILTLAAIYVALLGIFSAEKEFRRWNNMHDSIHPGELYALVWTALIVSLIIGGIYMNKSYHLPAEVSASYIAVISILAITRESKNFYKKRKQSTR